MPFQMNVEKVSGEGVIAENRRDEQRKIIKFNHLVANCVILYNVFVVSKELQKLAQEGREFDEQAVAVLSPTSAITSTALDITSSI